MAVDSRAMMDGATITAWMSNAAASLTANRDYLIQLDSAIGDGDHGVNMCRGFVAVTQALANESESAPGKLLALVGRTLISTVGGASGPLWGSAFRRAGRALGDAPSFGLAQLADALAAALAAVEELSAAAPGDKTMVDALSPAVDVLRKQIDKGASPVDALGAAANAAEEGMRSTIAMQARKGRASYLGERSIGHQDPGATTAALIIRALEQAVRGD